MIDGYEVGESLAVTGISQVSKAINSDTGEAVALKLPLEGRGAERIQHEIAIHHRLGHSSFIAAMDGAGTWNDLPFIATRMQEKGTLENAIPIIKRDAAVSNLFERIQNSDVDGDESQATSVTPTIIEELRNEGLPRYLVEVAKQDVTPVTHRYLSIIANAAVRIGHPAALDDGVAKEILLQLLRDKAVGQRPIDTQLFKRNVRIMAHAAKGLVVLHDAGVVHRDIKPANIGVDLTDTGRLIDLGIADEMYKKNDDDTIWGTPGQSIAPEGYRGDILPQGDVWAHAMASFYALTGVRAFDPPRERTVMGYYQQASDGPHRSLRDFNPSIPSDLDRIVTDALHPDPRKRPSAQEVQEVYSRAA